MHPNDRLAPNPRLTALHAFVVSYERRRGECLELSLLMHDMHALRDAIESAIGAGDPELYSAAVAVVRTFYAEALPRAA